MYKQKGDPKQNRRGGGGVWPKEKKGVRQLGMDN